ncbi:hypothetical protein OGAPHI_000965 [Ogataea philodendri]|uniref:SH3 domain-containing protein n=1 Tax=Ogataea philodendri TaxID=1378263 RepID=A0A9P8PF79_9ASCO|nr:uncharacterized protein OGAPHI_000965 [Ogataea philodendri]KAH3670450.1 hypothetical protein OGAPHI_000965 [Ogataea philodendri]
MNIDQRKQYTRKDLDQDEEFWLQQDSLAIDLRQMPPSRRTFLPDELSNSSSQASSTVIHTHHQGDAKRTVDDLKHAVSGTLDTDKMFEDTLRALEDECGNGEDEEDAKSKDSEDDFNDYIDGMLPSPPSSPPRELDPNKLYALYDFSGPDPSHLELSKDDSVVLLNDSDSYWWLVRRNSDKEVGFAPAEILETFEERLARLNCWKNEVIERQDTSCLSVNDLKEFENNSQRVYSGSNLTLYENHNDSSKSEQSLLGRKSSLKRSKSSIRKTVSFVPANLPDLKEVDDGKSETGSDSPFKPGSLVVNKRVSNTNFLVRNLDDYQQHARFSFQEKADDDDDDDDESISSFDTNAYDESSSSPEKADYKQESIHSVGSFSPSATSESEPDNSNTTIDETAQQTKSFKTLSFQEQRTKFLENEKPQLAERETSNDSTSSSLSQQKNVSSYSSDSLTPQASQSELTKPGSLHPITNELFNPLFNQLEVLENMLNDFIVTDKEHV